MSEEILDTVFSLSFMGKISMDLQEIKNSNKYSMIRI